MSKYSRYSLDLSETARANIWANEQDGTTLEKVVYDYIKDLETLAKERIKEWNDDSPTFSRFKYTPEKVKCALGTLRFRADELDTIIWNEGRKKKNKWVAKTKKRY